MALDWLTGRERIYHRLLPGGQGCSQWDRYGRRKAGVGQRLVEQLQHLLAVLSLSRPSGEPWPTLIQTYAAVRIKTIKDIRRYNEAF